MALYGLDLSVYQNTAAVDLAKDFVIMRATYGLTYVDPTCDTKYQYAKSKGKLRGVYHFALPQTNSAVAEADFFINNTKGYWSAKDAILVLDFETNTNVAWAKAWLDRVKSRTGVKPLIYMSASTIRAVDWSPVAKADYGLWVAGYPSKYNVANPPTPGEAEMPYNISPWSFSAIWQYSSSAGKLDRDIAHMTKTAWNLYCGKSTVPPPVITTKEITTVNEVIPFTAENKDDPTLDAGKEVVVVEGVNGRHTVIYTVTYTNGKETQRVLKSDVTIAPINKVIRVGIKQPTPPEEPNVPTDPTTPTDPTPPAEPVNPIFAVLKAVLEFLSSILSKLKKK